MLTRSCRHDGPCTLTGQEGARGAGGNRGRQLLKGPQRVAWWARASSCVLLGCGLEPQLMDIREATD